MSTVVNIDAKKITVELSSLPIGAGFLNPENDVYYIRCEQSKDYPTQCMVMRVKSKCMHSYPPFTTSRLFLSTQVIPMNVEINMS